MMAADKENSGGRLAEAVDEQAKRKQKARDERRYGVWFGLGMFGLIGWAIAVPTLLGVALGMWLDSVSPMTFSWTLTLIFAGVMLGCYNAWRWISKEGGKE